MRGRLDPVQRNDTMDTNDNPLSSRLRPGVECAPWVVDEVRRLEARQVSDGLLLIADERHRHVTVEGYTPAHDDEHGDGAMCSAAGLYALQAGLPDFVRDYYRQSPGDAPPNWPWSPEWWKPGADNSNASRIRELVKAGSLIVAEIERLQRLDGGA